MIKLYFTIQNRNNYFHDQFINTTPCIEAEEKRCLITLQTFISNDNKPAVSVNMSTYILKLFTFNTEDGISRGPFIQQINIYLKKKISFIMLDEIKIVSTN